MTVSYRGRIDPIWGPVLVVGIVAAGAAAVNSPDTRNYVRQALSQIYAASSEVSPSSLVSDVREFADPVEVNWSPIDMVRRHFFDARRASCTTREELIPGVKEVSNEVCKISPWYASVVGKVDELDRRFEQIGEKLKRYLGPEQSDLSGF